MKCRAWVASTAHGSAVPCRAARPILRSMDAARGASAPRASPTSRRPARLCRMAWSLVGLRDSWWGRLEMLDSPQATASSTGGLAEEPSGDGGSAKEAEKETLGSNVPWGSGKILEVMILWLFAFCVLRTGIWRLGMIILGINHESHLSPAGQAAFTLGLDMSMLGATIFILKRSLARFRPLREKGLFPLKRKGNWWIYVLMSCLWIPLVDCLGARIMTWFPDEVVHNTMEMQLGKGCTIPNVLYFILLSICAPVWEETMFRGFLLPSLGKFLPETLAILCSSSVFAIMHGSLKQFLPLFILGVVIARAYVASNNLLPAIVLHSLYNVYVFLHVLFCVP